MLKGIINGFVVCPFILLAGLMGLGLQVDLLAGYLSCVAIVFVVVVIPITTQKSIAVDLVRDMLVAIVSSASLGKEDDSKK